MFRLFYLNVFFVYSITVVAQRERVHLDLDKYSCRAGDTIYFKGVVFKGTYPTSTSTNLYVALYSESGGLFQKYIFPIVQSQSIGQIILPDSIPTNNYYIVALTKQQLNYDTAAFFSVPILVYNKDKPNLIHHKKQVAGVRPATSGVIKGIGWLTTIYKGKLSSLLEIDSGAAARHLKLISPISKDSALKIDVTLTSADRYKYSLFAIDSAKENQIILLYEDSVLIGRQSIHLKDKPREVKVIADTLDTSPFGYNAWKLAIPNSPAYFTSISVVDADRSQPSAAPITQLNDSYTDDLTVSERLSDTAYMTYTGKATKLSGKLIKDPFSKEIVIDGTRDTNFLFTKVVKINAAGDFKLDSLFFFGNIDLRFQINKEEDGRTKDVKLSLAKFALPLVDTSFFKTNWEDDILPIGKTDTFYTKTELQTSDLATFKTLKSVTVVGRKDLRKELDDEYTTGPFSEPALYVYDLRDDSSEYNRDLFNYLGAQGGRLQYDPVKDCMHDELEHPIHYFVDEIEYNDPHALRMFDFDRLAYVKVLESDFVSTERPTFGYSRPSGPSPLKLGVPVQKTALNVCVYTRKGKDFRTMRGGMNKLAVEGYNEVLKFNTDKVTLYWNPVESGNTFTIRFNNSETTKRFRVKVEGMTYSGKVVQYETVLP
jgi:hypothetical protein